MAKYDAIYEGRIPPDVRANCAAYPHVVSHQGFACHIKKLALKVMKSLLTHTKQ